MATGTGKSKIAVDRVVELLAEKTHAKILLVVPTTRLRDNNWKEEFIKWGAGDQWEKIIRSCYVSVVKLTSTYWDLVILDEAHNITDFNSGFFDTNQVREVMGLTATPPRDLEKMFLLSAIAPICFIYTMDEAVSHGLVAPYQITLYSIPLDGKDKYLEGGTKAKPFKTTEVAKYQYLSKRIMQSNFMDEKMQKFTRIHRMTFLKQLKSKTLAVQKLLDLSPPDQRMLIFCGGIAQSEYLLPGQTYHSKSSEDALNAFIQGSISKLCCVAALNEGINIPHIDSALVASFDSNPKNIIQRIGRIVRMREDHTARIGILVSQGTVEEEWIEKALVDFDSDKIVYQDIRNVKKVLA